MSAHERTVTDLETTALEALTGWDDPEAEADVEPSRAAVRELARRAEQTDRYKRAHEVTAAFANDKLIPRAVAAEAALEEALRVTAAAAEVDTARIEAAEQRADDYADTLREIADYRYPLNGVLEAIVAIKSVARAALDRHTTPAPTEWGPDHPSYDEMGQ
jgi:hypothetical protein